MGGGRNFQNFNVLGGANELKLAEKCTKFGNWPPTIIEGKIIENLTKFCVTVRALFRLIFTSWLSNLWHLCCSFSSSDSNYSFCIRRRDMSTTACYFSNTGNHFVCLYIYSFISSRNVCTASLQLKSASYRFTNILHRNKSSWNPTKN